MRYTIHGFSQQRAVDLGLSNDDLLFLRWLSDFSNTGKMERKEIKGYLYYWVNYQTVCEELPILATKKDTLYRKLKKLCDVKVLKHTTIKIDGTYSYYGFGSAFLSLVSDSFEGGYGKKSVGGTEKNPKGVRKKIPTKDSSIINSSIKETHTDLKTLCVEIQQAIGEKLTQKTVQMLINGSNLEVVKQYISNWDKYRPFAKTTQSAYFIHCIQNNIPVPTVQATTTPPTYANFDQRQYTEDEYEKFYANVNN